MSETKIKPCKTLMLDVDIESLDSLKADLIAVGFDVTACESTVEAEKMLDEQKFDLFITGLMLEEEDTGFTVCFHTKKKLPEMPIIMVTNVGSKTGIEFDASTDEERAWIKADVILEKPVRKEQLFREIERLVK